MSANRHFARLLIANRGEIAIRIAQAAREASIPTVALFSEDDAQALHVVRADHGVAMKGVGAAPYLDIEQIIAIAKAEGCDAVHPGYGFLSENPLFAARCEQEQITFVGPGAELLELFGNKVAARQVASGAGVPVLPATKAGIGVEEASQFVVDNGGAAIIKAVAGGGGRGMRIVRDVAEVEEALKRCASEAAAAFGNGEVYMEKLLERALHIEVQVLGDGTGAVSHLGERDCTIQRRHQKIVEIAPSPQLPNGLRQRIHSAAIAIAKAAGYRNIGTFEFLVDATALTDESAFYFIETNPRIQVEHTVTEEITGIDLVRTQFDLAAGRTLLELSLSQKDLPAPRGYSIQFRINMERMTADGTPMPGGGTIDRFSLPHGPGVRVDTLGYSGYKTSPNFDSLLAKVIVSSPRPHFADVLARSVRALGDLQVTGVVTNTDFLLNLIESEDFINTTVYTRFIDDHLPELTRARAVSRWPDAQRAGTTAARINPADPLAVLNYGKQDSSEAAVKLESGVVPLRASMQATIVSVLVEPGDAVHAGAELIVLNAMKMEHVITATVSGVIKDVTVTPGDTINEGTILTTILEQSLPAAEDEQQEEIDLDVPRPDLAEVLRRRELTTDASRRTQVEKRHARGGRSARENVLDLCDEGSFMQYGSLAVGQGLRGDIDELLDYAPSDGLVMGLGHVNGATFDETRSRIAAVAYDYSVLAGTQGSMNHKLMDRMFNVAQKLTLPVVLFSEGGGGRAGGGSRAADAPRGMSRSITGGGGLNTPSWMLLGQLSGRVPLVGINAGMCFAGNAALLGCCDVIIATANSSIGMGGPAMIEGGGLGVYRPEEVGPMSIQVPNGVVDIAVEDEAEAVAVAKQYLSYFQGRVEDWTCADQRLLRHAIPENRLRVYDIRKLLANFADEGSVLELRPGFGKAMLTAFIRLEGRPVGVIANNPEFLSGAIDSDAADKAARFMTLCDAFDIPLLFLCDTPGIMVGPEAEKQGTVRHAARMFVTGASVTVPSFMVILRKSYGLGAQAMAGGCQRMPGFVVAWPTSEFGGMGLEGQVKLGQRARLEAISDPAERQAEFERMVEAAYDHGKGLNAGHVFEIDDVIDPADTRKWVVAGLKASPPPLPGRQRKRPCVDTW